MPKSLLNTLHTSNTQLINDILFNISSPYILKKIPRLLDDLTDNKAADEH
jgi:hypothetical protein